MSRSKLAILVFGLAIGFTTLMGAGAVVAVGLYFVAKAHAADPPSTITVDKDVVYMKAGDKPLKMDIAKPKSGEGPFPAVICIHGGGWRGGDKTQMNNSIYALAQQGYVAATIQYRLVPEARFPSQIQEARAAVQYVRAHAKELNVDPDRIGVIGGSAGAHLALLIGTTGDKEFEPVGDNPTVSTKVNVVVSLAGPTDLTPEFPAPAQKMVDDLLNKPKKDKSEDYAKASPLHYVTPGDAPILMVHGTKDELVPYDQTTKLLDACKKAGVEAELFTIKDGGHGGGGDPKEWAAAIVKSAEFLSKHLKQKPAEITGKVPADK